MDLTHPIESVIPGAQGRVLRALLGSGREMSTSDVARVADISQPHASRVLGRLVDLGIVRRRHVPPSLMHQLVAGNAVVTMLESLGALPTQAIEHLRLGAQHLRPAPRAAILFGSLARGTASVESDIDVLVVRPSDVDDVAWASAIDAWVDDVQRFVGNSVNLIEIETEEWTARRDESDGLFASIRAEGIDLLTKSTAVRGSK
jgi:predicted nucleotidyltransferase